VQHLVLIIGSLCPCHLAPCDKRKHTAYAHQQATSQASTDSAWTHPVWLPHSTLGFQRPVGRRSYHNKPRLLCRYQFTNVRYWTAAAARARWQL